VRPRRLRAIRHASISGPLVLVVAAGCMLAACGDDDASQAGGPTSAAACDVAFDGRLRDGLLTTAITSHEGDTVEVDPHYEVHRGGELIGYLVVGSGGSNPARGTFVEHDDPALGFDDFGYGVGRREPYRGRFIVGGSVRRGDELSTTARAACPDVQITTSVR
jgi:hypothetical protein